VWGVGTIFNASSDTRIHKLQRMHASDEIRSCDPLLLDITMSLYQVLNCITFPPFPVMSPPYSYSFKSSPLLPITLGVEGIVVPDNTKKHTFGRNPLDEGSACRRDLYLPTHSTHNYQTSMLPEGFESTIVARERPQNPASDHASTGIGSSLYVAVK